MAIFDFSLTLHFTVHFAPFYSENHPVEGNANASASIPAFLISNRDGHPARVIIFRILLIEKGSFLFFFDFTFRSALYTILFRKSSSRGPMQMQVPVSEHSSSLTEMDTPQGKSFFESF